MTRSQAFICRAWCSARPVEILADLDRRLELGGEAGIALEIVVDDRLLDPGEAEIVDRVAPFQCLAEVKSLVEIDHQPDLAPDGSADGLNCRKVVGDTIAAEA